MNGGEFMKIRENPFHQMLTDGTLGLWFCTVLFATFVYISNPSGFAVAQTSDNSRSSSIEEDNTVITTSLEAISNILKAQFAIRDQIKILRESIESAGSDVEKTELGEKLKTLNAETLKLDQRIVSLATGVSQSDINPSNEQFDLQRELEQLIRPFVWILKSATENARQIEQLKRTVLAATKQQKLATEAIARLDRMMEQAAANPTLTDRLKDISRDWVNRQTNARDLAATASQQLQTRLSKRTDAGETTKEAFTSFFNNRGRNLVYGILGFAVTILIMRLIRRAAMRLIGSPRNRSFPVRISALIYDIATLATAFGTTLAIFNAYNDWLLTGFMLLVFIALGWFTLRSLPSLFEQITLLLNLGAVQEGERLVINGVPWRVAKLDLYTTLENKSLRGGSFTVPVRELRGQHSREVDNNEEWFPSEEGDWVVLENGLWAEVVLQSPEAVHLREEGGATFYYPVQSFLEQNPKNLADGYRVTVEFGIDYSHQEIATKEIPVALKADLENKLADLVDKEHLRGVYVTLFRAGESSLDYEIEADIGPNCGHLYEPIEHAIARFAVECCTQNKWNIPFPQLTVHKS